MIGKLILRLFHSRTATHVLHLRTRSYAAHKALNEYYDAIIPLVDSLAEAYSGHHGLISFPASHEYTPPGEQPVKYLQDLLDYVEDTRYEAVDKSETFLQNIIDEIVELITSTIYKLRFLS